MLHCFILVWGRIYTTSHESRQKNPQFNFPYRYKDDVLSLNNSKFSEYLEFIYPRELENEETFGTITSSSYIYIYIDNGKLTTRLYDKRNGINCPIVSFPFLSSNIPSVPAYGVYVSQLIHYNRACCEYQNFLERRKLLKRDCWLRDTKKKLNWCQYLV